MNLTLLALIEVVLMAGGAASSLRLVRKIGRGERKLVVMASITVWLVLFGMVPFFVFALAVPPGHPGNPGAPAFETAVLNLVPWALVASPVLGVAQAFRLTARRPTR
ncbi:MAG TPA: hypothetical protein VHA57_04520 [Actinomycetota bacterium]|nr:hypothetical protein [Actinomycetota bacterium]